MNDESLIVSLKRPAKVAAESPSPALRPPAPRRVPPAVIGLVALAVLAGAMYVFFFKPDGAEISTDTKSATPEVETTIEAKDLIEKVGRLIALPEGEEPTVATVSDPEKLKDQAFFANAKVGYKVLIYTQARKAYLYDPAQNKLIEVAPITTEVQ